MNLSENRRRNYVFLLPLFVIALLYQLVYTAEVVKLRLHPGKELDIPIEVNNGTIAALSDNAKKAGLHAGDRVISINGKPIHNEIDLYSSFRQKASGTPLDVQVISKHGGAQDTFRIPPTPPDKPPSFLDWLVIIAFTAAMLFCIVIGVYVAAILPYDPRAISFFGLMCGTSQMISSAQAYDFPRILWLFAYSFHIAAFLAWSICFVWFALEFPNRFQWDIRRPWIRWTFLGPLILWQGLIFISTIAACFDYSALRWLNRIVDVFVFNIAFLMTATGAFFFTALGVKQGKSKNRDSRRRLRLLYAGTLISLTPIAILILYQTITHRNMYNAVPESWVIPIAFVFCLFPLTFAYVIVAERASDLRVVLRQGVRYALARGGARFALGIVAALVCLGVSRIIFGTMLDRDSQITLFILLCVALFLIVRRTRARFMVWLDRKFFREAYNSELVLQQLTESVTSIVNEQEMLETVSRRIADSLHVPNFAVLLNAEGQLRPVYCLGLHVPNETALPETSKTVEVINQAKDAAPIYYDRGDNWVHTAPENELVTLKALNAQLLLPIHGKNKLLGLLSLGPKRSEEPYSRSDVQLLRSVAAQTGLALENSRLTKAVANEIAQREKLNREIEIAREVQERLFPQRLPVLAGIDYYGACRPALGVGGDYYDFLTLPNGDLGIAIGDVSGKGIAAALLMASLQASLRGQALLGQGDLARLMTNVNQLVYDATPINRYATFFYGQYHRESRVFSYVNAGHNPPVVLRRVSDGGAHVIRLDTGGPVVGLFPAAPYQQGSLVMEPGDIFVGFTDGISEAMNPQEEEWGEERFIPAIEAHADESASEIIPKLLAEADRFVSGAPQHDDMTLVVVKMSPGPEQSPVG